MDHVYFVHRNTLLEDGSNFDGTWDVMGIFSSKEKALECCLGAFDSVCGPIPFDTLLPEKRGAVHQDGSEPEFFWPNLPEAYVGRVRGSVI